MKIQTCPFCGGEGILFTGISCNSSYAKVYCDKCKAGTKEVFDKLHNGQFVEIAVEMWNKRAGELAERKKGEWIYDNPNTFKCSKCNKYLGIGCGNMKMNFCPNCGADMREQKLQNGDNDTLQSGLMNAT